MTRIDLQTMTADPRSPGSIRRSPDALVIAALMIGIAVLAYLASTLFEGFYEGVPASIPVNAVSASCTAAVANGECEAILIRLNPGRFHLRTKTTASSVTLRIGDASGISTAHVLLIRSRVAGRVRIGSTFADVPAENVRALIPVGDADRASSSIWFEPRVATTAVVIDEIGFFSTDAGLTGPRRQPFPFISAFRLYAMFAVLFAFGVCFVMVLAAYVVPRTMRTTGPWLMGALCFVICLLEVQTNFSPYWKSDLRAFYASETVESTPDGNLTGGLYAGVRLYSGLGLTVPGDKVQWHRMPGYGLLCTLAAAIGRTTNVIDAALVMVVLQAFVYAAGVAAFVAVAPRLFGVGVSYLIGVLLMLLPKQLFYTQVDSIAAPMAMLVAAALIVYVSESEAGQPLRLRTFVLVNAAFALWFVMRNDVLPGWFVVAMLLARRRVAYMAIPAALALTIAAGWALYKLPYRHEIDPLPTNTGEVFFLSLCDVPNTLPYPCTDDGYFAWINRLLPGVDHTSRRASNAAVVEVVKYWGIYPMHFALMVWTKLDRAIHEEFWSGIFSRFNKLYTVVREHNVAVFLLGAVLVAIAVDHQRWRTLLLAWPLWLNMPLYFVVWASSGRFYPPADVAVVITAIPLLGEAGFFRQIAHHRYRALVVAAAIVAFVAISTRFEEWVQLQPAVHYWAPLLDPQTSSLVAPR